jgi:hypothetical protein
MLDSYQNEIALRLDEGYELSDIERYLIEPAIGLNDDERAALWLYAWSYQASSPRPSYTYAPA